MLPQFLCVKRYEYFLNMWKQQVVSISWKCRKKVVIKFRCTWYRRPEENEEIYRYIFSLCNRFVNKSRSILVIPSSFFFATVKQWSVCLYSEYNSLNVTAVKRINASQTKYSNYICNKMLVVRMCIYDCVTNHNCQWNPVICGFNFQFYYLIWYKRCSLSLSLVSAPFGLYSHLLCWLLDKNVHQTIEESL